jgi:hypothetical protein
MTRMRDGLIALGILIVAVVVIVGLNRYSASKWRVSGKPESYGTAYTGEMPAPVRMEQFEDAPAVSIQKVGDNDQMKEEEKKEGFVGEQKSTDYSQDPALQQLRQASCFPKATLAPEELLPQDNASLWAQTNPDGAGSLKDRNFLQAGALIGINTVGQTLKNPNLGLRSEPINPKVPVSPWLNSSFEGDLNRTPFELGGCA